MKKITEDETVFISTITFPDHIATITELFSQKGLTVSWSGSGPLKEEDGGFSRYRVQSSTGRPLCFIETCWVAKVDVLRIFLVTPSKNKIWDEELKKNSDLFGVSRYYSNAASSCLDGIHFQAMDNRYLAYEIVKDRIQPSQVKILSDIFVDTFLNKVENKGDKYELQSLEQFLKQQLSA